MLTQPNLKHTFLFPTKPTHLISLVKPSTIPQRDFDRTRQTAAPPLKSNPHTLVVLAIGLNCSHR